MKVFLYVHAGRNGLETRDVQHVDLHHYSLFHALNWAETAEIGDYRVLPDGFELLVRIS